MGQKIGFVCSILIVFSLVNIAYSSVKCCTNPLDYYLPIGPSCYLNTDGYNTPRGILESHGFAVAEINLTTDDGYNFLVVRAFENVTKGPVVFAHGIYMNSRALLCMTNYTLVFTLIKNGYDVYLINFRGTIYSTGHTYLTQADYSYWNYSFHHLGIYEVKQTVDLVYLRSGKCLLMGYSMGTSAILVYTSLYPDDAKAKVKGVIALAPVAYLNTNIRSSLGKLALLWPVLQPFVKEIFNGKLLPRNEAILSLCSRGPVEMTVCYSIMVSLFGDDYGCLDFATRPVCLVNVPDAVSEFVVTHYSQIIKSGIFQQYDYGLTGNLAAYGQATPPEYPVVNCNVPMALVYGNNDWLATPETVQILWGKLSPEAQCKLIPVNDHWTHDDFITCKRQYNSVYDNLMTTIDSLNNGTCA